MADGVKRPANLREITGQIASEEEFIRQGGGKAGTERQRKLGRMPARERIAALLDDPNDFLELGLWAAHKMYPTAGDVPAAGVVVGIGKVAGRQTMIVANDATVKAGAFFPQTCKKVLRAQRVATQCSLPVIYLVDSAGVYLPMQDEIFPDEDDFGRIFRNNSVMSGMGIPQLAAIMGNCVAGGAYLPVLCDKMLMTEGSGLYLAGPALVKAAIGQKVEAEELGGAAMHAQISGTVDFREKDDPTCIERLRSLAGLWPMDTDTGNLLEPTMPELKAETAYELVGGDGRTEYDLRILLKSIVDTGSIEEFKAEYGMSLVTAFARIDGRAVGVVGNQRMRTQSKRGELQMGGVIYADSAEKAARFIMDCNQTGLPLVFFQDVQGFMVGRDSEQSGIIRSGAKLVNAVSNSVVPKITVITGGSFGAGNYALCGKAFDPTFIFAWPNAQYAVMGANQAADTLFSLQQKARQKTGDFADADLKELRESIKQDYQNQTDIRYGAARGWVDAIIVPESTRQVLTKTLACVARKPYAGNFRTGVFQV